jgi:hypothetical protein
MKTNESRTWGITSEQKLESLPESSECVQKGAESVFLETKQSVQGARVFSPRKL